MTQKKKVARRSATFARGAALALACLGLVVAMAPAAAQDISRSITRMTTNLQQAARAARGAPAGFLVQDAAAEPAAQEQRRHEVVVGLAYEKADDAGHSVVVPLQYAYASQDELSEFRIESGWTRISGPGQTLRGVPSVTLLGTRLFDFTTSQNQARALGITLGLDIPTHGEVGSDRYGQQLRLVGVAGRDRWTGVAAAVVVHQNGHAPGLGSTVNVLHGEVQYRTPTANEKHRLIGKLDRSYRRGAGGNTTLAFEYDRVWSKASEANLILTRGLTRGARSTGIELDVVRRF